MKKHIFAILASVSIIALCSCEKTEMQNSSAKIEVRDHCIDDCTECPVDDCCCIVELLTIGATTLHFCSTSGTCLSTMACSVGGLGGCPDISGFRESIMLQNASDRDIFCVPKNAPFGITSATGTPTIRITCQPGLINPQWVTIQLNTPPDKPYWSTGSDCSLTSCF